MKSVGSPIASYGTNCLPAQQEPSKLVFSVIENVFISFVKNSIQSSLDDKHDLIYLSPSEGMQAEFNKCIKAKFKNKKFNQEKLSLVSIISSIWVKVKNQMDNELKISNNSIAIQEEKDWQKLADQFMHECHSKGLYGKFLTTRQAQVLMKFANGF